jgi:hypothetical protein
MSDWNSTKELSRQLIILFILSRYMAAPVYVSEIGLHDIRFFIFIFLAG